MTTNQPKTKKHTTTIRLWQDDVLFLKEFAVKSKVPYQQLVRQVLNDYVSTLKNNLEVI